MALKPLDVIDADDLTDADEEILDALHDGPLTKGAIVDKTGLHRNTVGNRLDALKFGDAIQPIHEGTALYELADDPRDETDAPERNQLERVAEALDEIEVAFERGDPDAARTALERAQETISDRDRDER